MCYSVMTHAGINSLNSIKINTHKINPEQEELKNMQIKKRKFNKWVQYIKNLHLTLNPIIQLNSPRKPLGLLLNHPESQEKIIHTYIMTYIEDITRRREDMNFIFEW